METNITNKKAKKVRPNLLKEIKGEDSFSLSLFRSDILELFQNVLKEDIDTRTKERIARLRARIEIELQDIDYDR